MLETAARTQVGTTIINVAYWPIATLPQEFTSAIPESGQTRTDANDPCCVKTHTSKKCRKCNSSTRAYAVQAQCDLPLLILVFDQDVLRSRRAPTFSHDQDPKRLSRGLENLIGSSVISPHRLTGERECKPQLRRPAPAPSGNHRHH